MQTTAQRPPIPVTRNKAGEYVFNDTAPAAPRPSRPTRPREAAARWTAKELEAHLRVWPAGSLRERTMGRVEEA